MLRKRALQSSLPKTAYPQEIATMNTTISVHFPMLHPLQENSSQNGQVLFDNPSPQAMLLIVNNGLWNQDQLSLI